MTNEKMNNNMNEEMNPKIHPKMQPLSDGNMEMVAGGSNRSENKENKPVRWDSKGNETHWLEYCRDDDEYEPYHYRCPYCGRLLHKGALGRLYCDPCDEGWFAINIPWGCRYEGIYPGC